MKSEETGVARTPGDATRSRLAKTGNKRRQWVDRPGEGYTNVDGSVKTASHARYGMSDAHEQAHRGAMDAPTRVACQACDWHYEGGFEEGHLAFREHLTAEHPKTLAAARRSIRRRRR